MSIIINDMLETIAPTPDESLVAQETSRKLAKLLAAKPEKPLQVRIESEEGEGEVVAIPESAFRLLREILTEMAKGNAVTFIPIHAELTAQQAADILNVSRSFLIEQLEKGEIPCKKVGVHRRVLFDDVLKYRQTMDRKRLDALDELSEIDQELGLGY